MPPRKKQKTGKSSNAPAPEEEEAGAAHDGDTAAGSAADSSGHGSSEYSSIPPFRYITVPRPQFDFEPLPTTPVNVAIGANTEVIQANGFENDDDVGDDDDGDDEQAASEKFQKALDEDEKHDQLLKPVGEHNHRKWVMLKEGWSMFCDWKRRSGYCQPDFLAMYIYNDFYGYGIQELLENLLLKFDAALKEKNVEEAKWDSWAVISAMALWLNAGEGSDYMMNDDGDRVVEISALVGIALLTALAMVETSGELKTDSKFLDLGIVITSFLRWAEDHEDAGIEDDAVAWREHAVAYYERSGLGVEKGVSGTAELLKKFRDTSPPAPKERQDPWGWTAKLKMYDARHEMGGTNFDLTKWSRRQRAQYAFDKKDPLAEFSDKDLKDGVLQIG
ncbi:hypothetical protein BU23DRAFT_558647 [Bimuria novae-zelandiae CBS 107.79]|uniref:SAP domain-containing protein n=1 Tax=Bimuria novae-zelandiae CBS 107.79 TaxID=1447943 RepID=A0A6A5UTV1_9PLEO|nr:hypothetical protein BU23DRAFT_558647 [Bimuria novae-zelandiae CBS 107.79]